MNPLSGNPFFGDGTSVEQFRDPSRPPGLDGYRSFFAAKLTSKTTSSGTNLYAWIEQVINPTTGLYQDANPARSGTATNSPAIELNNADIATPVYVLMRQKGQGPVKGLTYEFQYAPSSAAVSSWKSPPCRAATTAALPSYNYSNGVSGTGATITATSNGALPAQDGVTLIAGDDLFVKNEPVSPAYAPFNGLYTVTQVGSVSTPFILTRRSDTDSASELLGATVAIMEGTVNGNSIWKCTTVAPITIGTTALAWAKVYPPQLTGDVIGSGSIVTLAADDTWYQFPTTFTLPAAGTYLFTGVCGVTARMSGGAPGLVKVHLFNTTAGVQVGGDYPAPVEVSAFNYTYQVVTIMLKLTVTGATTFCYRGLRYVASSGATWTNASLGGGFTPVTYGWLKLTD